MVRYNEKNKVELLKCVKNLNYFEIEGVRYVNYKIYKKSMCKY